MQKQILVTGGAGFVGYHLVKGLLESTQHRVLIFDNFMRGRKDEYFNSLLEKYSSRLKVYDAEEGLPEEPVDIVFHLAALNGTRYFYEMPYELLRNNTLITLKLLDFYKDKKVKFLYASSSEVYADADPKVPTAEDAEVGFKDIFNPRWSYGLSKLHGELSVINAARKANGFEYVIFRLHNAYGPRMGYEHVIPGIIKRMHDKEDPMVIKNPDDTRAFCYITDVVDPLLLLMDCEQANGQVVHVGNPEEVSVWELAQKMAKVYNYQAELKKGEKLDVGSTPRRCPDISKLQKLTSFVPKVNLEQGLKLTYDFYNKDLGK